MLNPGPRDRDETSSGCRRFGAIRSEGAGKPKLVFGPLRALGEIKEIRSCSGVATLA